MVSGTLGWNGQEVIYLRTRTGTPPGVGLGLKPIPMFLKAGDYIELGIEGLGQSAQKAVAYHEA
jgi:hypothetical protein